MKSYIPSLQLVSFPDYPFHFSGKGSFAKDLWKTRKQLLSFIQWEQNEVNKLVIANAISFVVSDHRYGFRSDFLPSIFITHQVNLALKWWQKPAQWLHKKLMSQFSSIWIMDDENQPLAGKLSQRKNLKNAFYIGHFSRFENKKCEKTIQLGICNGPAPYNQQLLEKLTQNKELDWIISSIPHTDERVIQPENWQKTDELFYKAKTIYGYCGYSTLMDVKLLECDAVLIPTPGQTEQEYLFQRLKVSRL